MGKIAQTERCVRRYNMKPGQEIKKKGSPRGLQKRYNNNTTTTPLRTTIIIIQIRQQAGSGAPLTSPPAILWRRFYISKRQKRKGDQ